MAVAVRKKAEWNRGWKVESQSSSILVSSCWIKVMWTRKVLKNEPFAYGVGVFIRISLCVNIEDAEKRA